MQRTVQQALLLLGELLGGQQSRITQLTELDVWPIAPRLWYPTISESQLDAAQQLFAPSAITDDAGTMLFAIHNYVIEIDGTVITDRIRLNQIALNLLSNAVKYTPSGGTTASPGGAGSGGAS